MGTIHLNFNSWKSDYFAHKKFDSMLINFCNARKKR